MKQKKEINGGGEPGRLLRVIKQFCYQQINFYLFGM